MHYNSGRDISYKQILTPSTSKTTTCGAGRINSWANEVDAVTIDAVTKKIISWEAAIIS